MELSPQEIRVIGCLMEKSVVTPDQYPLSLNSLTNACNQKSSREPVMALTQGAVQHTARQLADKYLISIREGKGSVEKYAQRFCNTPMAEHQFSKAEYALICLLLLRGAQTPGELRTRSGRLHDFADNAAVSEVLNALMAREGGALVARLPRQPGRQDHQYQHLFGGEIESVAEEVSGAPRAAPVRQDRVQQLEDRMQRLENALKSLADRLGEDVDLGDPPAPEQETSI